MKKYFYADGTNSYGPFTLDELKEKKISKNTKIWFQGLDDWKKAGSTPELEEIFLQVPPTIQVESVLNNETINTFDKLKLISIALWFIMGLIIVIFQIVGVYNTWAYVVSNLISATIPIFYALTLNNKKLKIIALVLGGLISYIMSY